MVKNYLFCLFLFCALGSWSQDSTAVTLTQDTSTYKGRQWLIGGLTTAGYGGSFIFLSEAWYKDYPRRSFHVFNDAGEWNQVDKIGHAWTAYQTSRFTTNMWRWAGFSPEKSVLLGTGSSLLYLLSIEYLDGHSVDWGWSWADVGANTVGAALYAGQELGWKEQKVAFKFSSHYKSYPQADLQQRADKLYGRSFQGRMLKDYNAQTYWLSFNLNAFLPRKNLPGWLNLAVGYGADGMFGGYENIARDKTGAITFDRRDIRRYRQWYLAPDVDLTKIKTRSKLLQSVLSAFHVLKFPTPALEFSQGRFRLRALAY